MVSIVYYWTRTPSFTIIRRTNYFFWWKRNNAMLEYIFSSEVYSPWVNIYKYEFKIALAFTLAW